MKQEHKYLIFIWIFIFIFIIDVVSMDTEYYEGGLAENSFFIIHGLYSQIQLAIELFCLFGIGFFWGAYWSTTK